MCCCCCYHTPCTHTLSTSITPLGRRAATVPTHTCNPQQGYQQCSQTRPGVCQIGGLEVQCTADNTPQNGDLITDRAPAAELPAAACQPGWLQPSLATAAADSRAPTKSKKTPNQVRGVQQGVNKNTCQEVRSVRRVISQSHARRPSCCFTRRHPVPPGVLRPCRGS